MELFRYMYSDEANLTGSNVMGVLYLAKKYMVPLLADKCIEYLQDSVDPSNVFSILTFAQKYEEKTLVDQCWEVIDKQTEETVKSDGFVTIERSLLEAVVVRDSLTIEEIELFKAVDLWATKECERQGLEADGAVKRRVLGEKLLTALRFPTIEQKDFASVVLDSKILTPDEIVSIIKCLNSVSKAPVGFPETRRPGFKGNLQRCCTFRVLESFCSSKWLSEKVYVLDFSLDRDITFHGVCFFGRANGSYSIDLTVIDRSGKTVWGSASGQFSSERLQCQAGSYNGFEVLFNRGIVLVKNSTYGIKAKITGPPVWNLGGHCDSSSVICSGVTFTFKDTQKQRREYGGQFPELLFSQKSP
ncbi:BTB/POZ domain-containing protein 6-like [Oculina patagonica]